MGGLYTGCKGLNRRRPCVGREFNAGVTRDERETDERPTPDTETETETETGKGYRDETDRNKTETRKKCARAVDKMQAADGNERRRGQRNFEA